MPGLVHFTELAREGIARQVRAGEVPLAAGSKAKAELAMLTPSLMQSSYLLALLGAEAELDLGPRLRARPKQVISRWFAERAGPDVRL